MGNRTWTLASNMATHTHEATFGAGRPSQLGSLHNLCWDSERQAFVRGDKGELIMGSWHRKVYPCSKALAAGVLFLCGQEAIQERFLRNVYAREDDAELFLCGEHLVSLQLAKAQSVAGTLRYRALASFAFQFYASDGTAQTVSLQHALCASFADTVRGIEYEEILRRID